MKLFSLSIIGFWVFAVLLGRALGLHGNEVDLTGVLANPSVAHWFGADDLGRDILARILRGVEVSFMVAVVVTIVTMLVGVTVGLLAGFYGGKLDKILMQITDIFLAFPGILLAIAFAVNVCTLFNGLGELRQINTGANFKFTQSPTCARIRVARRNAFTYDVAAYLAAFTFCAYRRSHV